MLFDISTMLDERVAYQLLSVSGAVAKPRDAVDRVIGQMEPVQTITHRHVERSRRRPFLAVAMNVKSFGIRSFVGETMDERRVAVVGEDNRNVGGED